MNHSFDIELAAELSVEAAIIFASIQHWIGHNRANGTNVKDGRTWVYNSRAAWSEQFPYLGEKQIRNAIEKLLDAGLIDRGNYSYGSVNRTYWYTLTEAGEVFGRKGQTVRPKGPDLGLVERAKPETDTNKTIENITTPLPPCRFDDFWKAWPSHSRKSGKQQCLTVWKSRKLDGMAEDILAAVEAWKASWDWQKKDGEYIPAPLTWLRREGWEAVPKAAAPVDEEIPF